ncbi:extracellular solute-binding protein [Halanaerobium sp. ST460_2HS_T2]|uniref:extracellular solute-binding protein n=1 Tax=Halanaerobium sp. ST460_2HS_T2 TaxID=2183914 RepID=UPI000DF2C004|nr:extracellular solute-binding protein [Halanaerobium sp. ST460_2HS_T2]RCW52192.1 carbohydrate ABC transporter substrate-binding protein (CUT1 family) [Halanaerobium sp. ST460_2HS_T2]
MKKKTLLIALLVLFAMTSVSFAQDYELVTPERIGNPDAEIVLTANIQRSDTLFAATDNRKDYIRKAAAEWAKAHPNARIDVQVAPTGQISMTMATLLTQAESGNAPDFAHIDSFWIGRFIENGYTKSLNKYMGEDAVNDFFGFTKDVVMKDGEMHAIWGETDARFLYYRKDWIEEPPRTWDETIDLALKMKEEKGVHGFLAWLGNWEGAVNGNVWPLFWAQDGEMFDENGRPVIGEGKNKEALVNSLGFLKRLVDTGAAPVMVSSITSSDPMLAEIRSDNVAMVANGSWLYNQIDDIIDDADEKWDFVPLPQMKADQRANSNGGWTWAVLSDDPVKQELAADYIMRVVGSKEAMAERTKVYNYLPTRESIYENDPYYSENERMIKLGESLEYGNARPANSLYNTVSELTQTALGRLLTGQTDDIEAEVDEIQREALSEWEANK